MIKRTPPPLLTAFVCAALLSGCAEESADHFNGYVEAELLYMSSQDAGVIATLAVREGDVVEAGDRLFSLDTERLSLAADQSTANAAAVQRRVQDTGALDQAVAEAEAELDRVKINLEQTAKLLRNAIVSQSRFDTDSALVDAAEARLQRARSERDAAQEDLKSAQAQAGLALQRLSDLAVNAPQAGTIERIYRRVGEVVAPGEPVIALLPPANLKLKFFAPEPMLSQFAPGADVTFTCDGCDNEFTARVSFVAREPQFTPPVIYSLDERKKLVFLIEARPTETTGLRPGLPVTVELP